MDHSDSQAGGGLEPAGAALRLPKFDSASDLDKQRRTFDALASAEAHYRTARSGFDSAFAKRPRRGIALNHQTRRNLEQLEPGISTDRGQSQSDRGLGRALEQENQGIER